MIFYIFNILIIMEVYRNFQFNINCKSLWLSVNNLVKCLSGKCVSGMTPTWFLVLLLVL